ncbi:sialate O-acetylesterase [Segetibacter koreensis]|uniref:sialate O-acetylesterase n=1 Tax=Segetibacter koreensis TaxID=398037 RepID=UPI000365774E|nr:sialate O-acetylesterase [Segetibacter koreensis]
MVLQQGIKVPVWGVAPAMSKVTIRLNCKTIVTKADTTGKWLVKLPVQKIGGPYTMLFINGSDSIALDNVMVGEVWVCSGQSNMEMPIGDWGKINNYQKEIATANFPAIRLMHLKKSASNTPEEEPELYDKEKWQKCSPATVSRFSAAAYFFAKNIYTRHHVPIGLIQATYGGTVAEAWVSGSSLKAIPEFAAGVHEIEMHPQRDLMQQYNSKLHQWLPEVDSRDSGYQQHRPVWADNNIDVSSWHTMTLPAYFDEAGLPEFYGVVWFRKKIIVGEKENKGLKINIGSMGDEDITYFNGQEVGRSKLAGQRLYYVPSKLVKKGENFLTIRLIVYRKYASVYGERERFSITSESGASISLAGEWYYKIGYTNSSLLPPDAPDEPNRPTVLYNAMINPIIPYGIRGVIWYQGEYNVGRALQYKTLFPMLITDWRKHWNQENFPFYFVQLANYNAIDSLPKESSWAELREAQTWALKLTNTAMAVAIDLGEAKDIHPKKKQEVGERLALIARAKIYGEKVVYAGPKYRSHGITGKTIEIQFTNAAGGLTTQGDTLVRGFSIAGEDHVFHGAKGTIKGNVVIVSSPEVANPEAVRYAWADNPVCNLYNQYGLPAEPFKIGR